MRHYWICEDCASENPYPEVTVCETCGMNITQSAEQQVIQEIKEEEKQKIRLKKEHEKRVKEEIRARRDAEKKRKQELLAAQQIERERKRIAEIEKKIQEKKARELKFSRILKKVIKVLNVWLVVCAITMTVLSIATLFEKSDKIKFNDALSNTSHNVQAEFYVIIGNKEIEGNENSERSVIARNIEDATKQASNKYLKIKNQCQYMGSTFHPIKKMEMLIDKVVEYTSGGE